MEVVGKKAKLAAADWESTGDIWRHLETGLVTHHLSIQSEFGQGVVWKFSATDSGRNVAAGMQAFAGKVQVEVQ